MARAGWIALVVGLVVVAVIFGGWGWGAVALAAILIGAAQVWRLTYRHGAYEAWSRRLYGGSSDESWVSNRGRFLDRKTSRRSN